MATGATEEHSFVWDRQGTRVRFQFHLDVEAKRNLARGETQLDAIWRAVERTIVDVLAAMEEPGDFAAMARLPGNSQELATKAIEHACAAMGFPPGDFENQRRSLAVRGFACAVLRVKLPMSIVAEILDRSPKRLWQAMRRLEAWQLAKARDFGGTLRPEWGPRKSAA